MIIRKSTLRRRAESGPSAHARTEVAPPSGARTFGASVKHWVFTSLGLGDDVPPIRELESLPFPDLLTALPVAGPDPEPLANLLDLAFLGRASAGEIDAELDGMPAGSTPWVAEHFVDDLFLADLVRRCLGVKIGGRQVPAHRRFLERVLAHPPGEVESIRYRQEILRELEEKPSSAAAVEGLFGGIFGLLAKLRASRDDARLEPARFRLDVLRSFRWVVDRMTEDFAASTSGLVRLHETGAQIRQSTGFHRMEALLDHHDRMATLELDAVVGADGRLRHLEIRSLRELKKNPFFRRPLRRWWDRLRSLYHRYSLESAEVVERIVMGIYHDIAPALARVVQLLCHLEVYLAARSFAAEARARGLGVCLAEIETGGHLRLRGLFNPLLLDLVERPVPTDLEAVSAAPVTLVTGPNSGGKTRLLQAVGIAQVLAQSGLYAPCAEGSFPLVDGLFASVVESDRADQPEGRLGTELVRLRTLFETVPPGSLILLDELCSGTNPSEAIEIVDLVLRLLHRLEPLAFVTTHFLDYAEELRVAPTLNGLAFLQAEVDAERGATYRFVPGVATTSLAIGTARRLGVAFDELERGLARRIGDGEDDPQGGG